MKKEESTHLVFNEEGVMVSSDIAPVFNFLINIQNEIENILGFNKKLESIRNSFMEMLDIVSYLGNELKKNNLDFEYKFKENPQNIHKKLEYNFPLRAQMIVLFASLDVLFNLHTAYEACNSDTNFLRNETMNKDKIDQFINSFILTEKNLYYQRNKARFSKINSTKFRKLRNSLTHFFSIGDNGIFLSPDLLKEKTKSLENSFKKNNYAHIISLSEDDLFNLIKEANTLRIKMWSDDFQKNSAQFKRKMHSVVKLVGKEGAVLVSPQNLKI